MREHQIAISLKPQQFELLQRLARERGFKSVTAYVKQKIVELAMGVDSDLAAVGSSGGSLSSSLSAEDSQALITELSRIHKELRGFVGSSAEDRSTAGLSAAAAASNIVFDAPAPGQVTAKPSTPTQSTSSISPPQAGSATTGSEPVSNQVLPSRSQPGFGFRLAPGRPAPPPPPQPPLESKDRLAGYREIMDDLEELADRAFAISPRLGSLDEEAPADAGPGRGGRGEGKSIVVDPILPASGKKSKDEEKPAKSREGSKKEESKISAHKPLNVVKPFSPGDLVGPSGAAPGAETAPVPASSENASGEPAPRSSPQSENGQVQSAPQAVAASDPASEMAAQPAVDTQPLTADNSSADSPAEPGGDPAFDASPAPAMPRVRAPLPGDDLLSELLDESLVAHAEAPRPPDNPFAGVRPVKGGTESGAGQGDSTEQAGEYAGDEEAKSDQSIADAADPAAVPVEGLPVQSPASPEHDSHTNDTAAGNAPDGAGSRDSKEQAGGEAEIAYKDLSGGDADDAGENKENEEAGATTPPPSSRRRPIPSLDSDSPGQSNMSGGPPPKRRRT